MKYITHTILSTIILLCSCTNKLANPDEGLFHILQYSHKFFKQHPEDFKNEVKFTRMNDQFTHDIKDSIQHSSWLIEDLPIKFEGIKEGKDGKYNVHFQSWLLPDGMHFSDENLQQFSFDIVGEVPSSYVEKLTDGQYYYIHGKFIKFLTDEQFHKYTSELPYTNHIGLEQVNKGFPGVNIDLGMMLFEIDSISDFKVY